jgi:8-oxo-dGTP diphosphatase
VKSLQSFQIGVKALIRRGNKILLIRRSGRYSKDNIEGIWDIPGGRIDFGEEPLDGLKREVQEETGLKIMTERILDASTIWKDDSTHIIRITYLCSLAKDSVSSLQISDEHTEFLWIDPTDIDFEIADPLLRKALSILAQPL